jgi:uncharacterized protein
VAKENAGDKENLGGIEIVGQLRVDNLQNRLILTGELTGKTVTVCDRCLESFDLAFDVPVEIQILRVTELEGEEDSCIIHQRNGEVALDVPLGELALVAIPQKRLCVEDCRGLCPQCGVNLNRETCGCHNEDEDPRWADLPTD